MANKTKIEWTEFNWNFLRGCSRVSEGCRNCYAEHVAHRFGGGWMKGEYAKLDWVVVGGESGHGARPMHPDW